MGSPGTIAQSIGGDNMTADQNEEVACDETANRISRISRFSMRRWFPRQVRDLRNEKHLRGRRRSSGNCSAMFSRPEPIAISQASVGGSSSVRGIRLDRGVRMPTHPRVQSDRTGYVPDMDDPINTRVSWHAHSDALNEQRTESIRGSEMV
jgi:hypothetical protein